MLDAAIGAVAIPVKLNVAITPDVTVNTLIDILFVGLVPPRLVPGIVSLSPTV